MIDVPVAGNRILLCIVYRRPEGHVLSKLFQKNRDRSHLFSHTVIIGDLNLNLLDTYKYYTVHLKTLISQFNLYFIPTLAPYHIRKVDS